MKNIVLAILILAGLVGFVVKSRQQPTIYNADGGSPTAVEVKAVGSNLQNERGW